MIHADASTIAATASSIAATAPSIAANTSTIDVSKREIRSKRILKALRELVFEVWTNPVHIAKWWGPTGFTNTIHSMDVRPGGRWDFIMHGPDGRDYKNLITYEEIIRPEKIVYTHDTGPKFRGTVLFADLGDTTELDMQILFETEEVRERTAREFGAVEGQQQTLDRLEAYLAERLAQRS